MKKLEEGGELAGELRTLRIIIALARFACHRRILLALGY
jgi:hypothetical protein